MNGGYTIIDCTGLELADTDPQTLTGAWDKAKTALATGKPIVATGCTYSDVPVTPVTCFGWYIATDEIVIVGATLHIHVKSDNTITVLDVAQ